MTRAILLAFALTATTAFAEPVVTVRNNGPAANRLSLVVLGDGYTAGEMNKYAAFVDLFTTYVFNQAPFKEYANYFNVYRIDLESNESGVDHPEWAIAKDTALDARYFCGNIQRALCFDYGKVDEVLARSATPASPDLVIIFVNDANYGGMGGRYAISSTNSSDIETMLHEAAHTLGLLADEYIDGSGANCRGTREPSEANATRQTERESVKWRHWIDDATKIPTTILAPGIPGLFEGGNHCATGVYRPTVDSKMRTLGKPFEQVNNEQLVRRFYNFVSPIDAVIPSTRNLTVKRGQAAEFLVERPQPATHDLSVAWTIDAREIGTDAALTLDTSALAPGRYTIEVTVRDDTPFVRSDPSEALVERFQWILEIVP